MKKNWTRNLLGTLLILAMLWSGTAMAGDDLDIESAGGDGAAEIVEEATDADLSTGDEALEAVSNYIPETDGTAASNAPELAIDADHFPDVVFREYVKGFDADENGTLSALECNNVNSIDIENMDIASLVGIEYFKQLERLSCIHTSITELILDDNPQLREIIAYSNRITRISVKNCPWLETLSLSNNQLSSLDLSGNEVLAALFCDRNAIDSIDIGNNPLLKEHLEKERNIVIDDSQSFVHWGEEAWDGWEYSLSIDPSTALMDGDTVLFSPVAAEINEASFPSEDFRGYVARECDGDGDGWLSRAEAEAVREITLRTRADCEEGVHPMNCPSLKGIEYFSRLESLECVGCGIKALNVSKNKKLRQLSCGSNALKKLNVSKNNKLTSLSCENNQLKKLTLPGSDRLKTLHCGGNRLTALNVTQNKRLTELDCSGNQLKKLAVAGNTKLAVLRCQDNRLTALDLSKNKKLKELRAEGNRIRKINLKNNEALRKTLKMKRKKASGDVYWGRREDGHFHTYLRIDAATKLTNGKKALYKK